jgi:hypothetical protein
VRRLRRLVRLVRNSVRARQIAGKLGPYCRDDLSPMLTVALGPPGEVIHMRHPVALLAAVGENKLMPKVNRVLGPGDEVIDVAAITPDSVTAVEAFAPLQVHQHRPHSAESIAFSPEQELMEVQRLTHKISIHAPHIAQPSRTDGILNQRIELPEAVRDTGLPFDCVVSFGRAV